MSDELEKLKAALKATEPAPDEGRKAEALARAMAEFERVQGSAAGARRMSDRPRKGAGFWTGATAMISRLTTRATLAGTASVAVIAVGIAVIGPNLRVPSGPRLEREVTTAPPPPASITEAPAPVVGEDRASDLAGGRARTDGEGAVADYRETVGQTEADAVTPAPAERLAEQETPADEPAPQPSATSEAEVTDELFAKVEEESAARAAPSVSVGLVAPSPVARDAMVAPEPDTEAYPEAEPNPLKVTAEAPVSTFSIDVDTASYAVVRSSLNAGRLPPVGAVRIEEMINYFPYDWPAPGDDEAPFRTTVSVMETPWNPGTRLVTVALQGQKPAEDERPPLNLVFLIDTSGSMQDANKLPLLKQSFRLMLSELRPEDEVSIVTYAGSAGQVLAPTPASNRAAILGALGRLAAGGSTAGQAGLVQAYATARGMAEDGELTRVILATDGDFNVGISDPGELKDYIARERESGTYLSVLGFGRGNLDDATMQALAQNGNGAAAYIDTLNEARKVLVDELSGALFPIADDVKVQVEWNPATVAEYRLIGYETRALAREDFNNDRVDAGEIGAGHSVTAIYEITPVGSEAVLTEPLRYGTPEAGSTESEFGFLRLRYKEPGEETSRLIETPIPVDTGEGGAEARFAAAIAGFGQLLTGATYLGDWGWDDAIALATTARGEDPFGYRAEAVGLMRLAESLSR
ncbi:MAG: von Willebrand factor type A domain-containing protein [Paracoccaceae bacterium]|nr:von Willebrand factor type A domain-containing protein [Paracoccaceae bacterium]